MTSSIGSGVMRVLSTITVTPEQPAGLFQAGTWDEWIGRHVHVVGLDPAFDHTLLAAEIIAGPRMVPDTSTGRYVEQVVDGGAAVLTVLTEAPDVPNYASYVRVLTSIPPARVQIVDAATGDVMVDRVCLPAPRTTGDALAVGEQQYTVTAVSWPNRNPASGSAGVNEDYQRVEVVPVASATPVQLAAPAPTP